MSNPKKSACKGKSTIFTYQHAVERRKKYRKRNGETLYIYKCNGCGFWHLGHKLKEELNK